MSLRRVFSIVFALTLSLPSLAQDRAAELDATPDASASSTTLAYTVAAFEVKGRWLGEAVLPLRNGDRWTPEKQSEVFAALRGFFDTDDFDPYLFSQAGELGVLYVDVVEDRDEATHTVKLIFRPLRVHLSFAKWGDNLLPIPRSGAATHYAGVPTPLLALRPALGLTYDRAFGTALAAGFHTDLLTLPETLNGRVSQRDPAHLELRFNGAKSFDDFYRSSAGLSYAYRRIGVSLQEFFLGIEYDGVKEPLAGQQHFSDTGGADGGATFKLASHTRLSFNTGYRHARDELADHFTRVRTDTDIQPNRVLIESLLPQPLGGFLRAAVWEDNGWTDHGVGFHQRLAGRVGYAREIALGPNRTIGLEVIGGGGRLWGDAPASRRFFGGNTAGQFLYDDVSESSLRNLPPGPLIRSFGQGEAVGTATGSARGGDAFWHLNVNLTLPIQKWSSPLIPPEDEVRQMLKSGINVSGRNGLIAALKTQGMSRDAAVAEADRTLNEIRPATEFIIDEANLYSVKPLLMFDAGGLMGAGDNATWFAVGGGFQLTIVTAKFELGYMHTLSGPAAGDPGNFFLRLVFQNLF